MNKIKFDDTKGIVYRISFSSNCLLIEEKLDKDKSKISINIDEIKRITVTIKVSTNWKGNRGFFQHVGYLHDSYIVNIDIKMTHNTKTLSSYSCDEQSTLFNIIKFLKNSPIQTKVRYELHCRDNIISAQIDNYIQKGKRLGTLQFIKMVCDNTETTIKKIFGCVALFILFLLFMFMAILPFIILYLNIIK